MRSSKQLQKVKRPEPPTPPKFQTAGDGAGLMAISSSPESWDRSVQAAFGSKDPDFRQLLLESIFSQCQNREDWLASMNGMLAAMAGLAPQDELQAMLAAQMLAVHHLAMSRLAGVNAENPDGADRRLNQANKLMRTFLMQVEALQRLRGKTTQQKMVIEHVHVHQGGQAIVGAVSQTRGRGNRREN